jgi:DNA-binding IclR family transcriptional regulator
VIATTKRATYGSFRDDDCLALLSYVAEHREIMTLSELAEGVGIPRTTLNLILMDGMSRSGRLAAVAERYRFEYVVHREALTYPRRGPRQRVRIIEVVRRGYE